MAKDRVERDDEDLVRLYLTDIGQYTLLTKDDEVRLAKAIEAGNANPGDIALLKVQASETMEFCAREAMQILGGIGYMRGSRVERIYREVRVDRIWEGTSEVQRNIIGERVLGLPREPDPFKGAPWQDIPRN